MRIYYARPIFTPGERDYNSSIEKMIDNLEIERQEWGNKKEDDPRSRAKRVFDSCFGGIAPANAVLAILSGTEVDDGTAAEIGLFFAMMESDASKKGIIGLLDDWRTDADSDRLQGKGLNDFLLGCVRRGGIIVHTPEEAAEQLKAWKDELGSPTTQNSGSVSVDTQSDQVDSGLSRHEGGVGPRIYFAAPQFTPYARSFVAEQAQFLRDRGMDVFVPRARARAEVGRLTPEGVFDQDYAALRSSNMLVALLDGTQPDDGVALELGLFYGLLRRDPSKKGILGYMTDSRGLRRKEHGYGCNHFPIGVIEKCGAVFDDFADIVAQIETWANDLSPDI